MDLSGADISSLCESSNSHMLEPNIHVMGGGGGASGDHLGQEVQPHYGIKALISASQICLDGARDRHWLSVCVERKW